MGAGSGPDLRGRKTSTAAFATAGAVLPASGISAWYTDRACNHIEGDVEVSQPGTPRGSWCSVLEPGHHRWALLLAPALAAFALLSLCRAARKGSVYVAVWALICALLSAQAIHVFSLPAYPGL
jgi:hypothetical protein